MCFVGWRPAFKVYSKWVALFGAAICVAIMFIIRWYYALVTFIIVLILYKIFDFLKPGELLSYTVNSRYSGPRCCGRHGLKTSLTVYKTSL